MPTLPIRAMLDAGFAALRRYRGLWLALYLVQFFGAALATFIIARMVAARLGTSPVLDRAVDGDLTALVYVLRHDAAMWGAAVVVGAGIAFGYVVLSLYLVGGVNAVLLRRPGTGREVVHCFGAGGAVTFLAYVRLLLWSLIPYAVTAVALGLGMAIGGDGALYELDGCGLAGKLLPPLLPFFLLAALTVTAVDYARIELSRRAAAAENLSAMRALLGAYRAILTDRRPLLHIALYMLFFAVVSIVYVAIVHELPMAGALGALGLFTMRQIVLVTRFAGGVVCAAGQVALAGTPASASPPADEAV